LPSIGTGIGTGVRALTFREDFTKAQRPRG
jgi:hypothetical protein